MALPFWDLVLRLSNSQTFAFNDLAIPFGVAPESDGTSRTSAFKFGQTISKTQ
ncbi:hypothetical protein [Pseudanabaena sp. UWO310]|uniref:hypothetical protein n=1 Tax=Pseudanabaena sp. UWO310 TaxID=2480795 RepID=UPI0016809A2B|nr:hypothetical protein [Pseudanabaena sp. UWO310]